MSEYNKAQEFHQNHAPTGPPPPNYPTQQYSQTGIPQATPIQNQQPQGQAMPKSASQVGEEYRAALFAQCASGVHEPTTKYGICGIITAVVCFPCGLICLFTDSEQRCARCNILLSK